MMRTARTLLVGATLLLLAACGGQGQEVPTGGASSQSSQSSPAQASPALEPSADSAPDAGGDAVPASAQTALVARSDQEVSVYDSPGATSPTMVLPATTGFGSARALLVVDHVDGWLEVSLPVRPNGSTGWIQTDAVELREVDRSIHVDLSARTLTLIVDGEEALSTPIAIGSPDAPTPTGSFYVVDKLATPGGSGPYGPFALGLSGYSDVFTDFAGGDGQIGIHGTDQPSSIGKAVSHGCVRVPNDVITALNELVPLGTPVVVADGPVPAGSAGSAAGSGA